MSTPSRFDDEARGELLCYLVVGELVAMARTGNWLKTGHLVELAHIWMNANEVTGTNILRSPAWWLTSHRISSPLPAS